MAHEIVSGYGRKIIAESAPGWGRLDAHGAQEDNPTPDATQPMDLSKLQPLYAQPEAATTADFEERFKAARAEREQRLVSVINGLNNHQLDRVIEYAQGLKEDA